MARDFDEYRRTTSQNRMERAVKIISNMGYTIDYRDEKMLQFKHKGEVVTYYPYKGWATGKSIKDGRGLINLISQLG